MNFDFDKLFETAGDALGKWFDYRRMDDNRDALNAFAMAQLGTGHQNTAEPVTVTSASPQPGMALPSWLMPLMLTGLGVGGLYLLTRK